jgi:hypothetical protein
MGPEGTASQDQSTDPNESALNLAELEHRKIAGFLVEEGGSG